MHVNISSSSDSFGSTLSCGTSAATTGESVCLHPRGGSHVISISKGYPSHFLFFYFVEPFFFHFGIHNPPTVAKRHALSNTSKSKIKASGPSMAFSHWSLRPRSLCDWPGLSSCVCVGPLQPSEPPPPPLRKQTVSRASIGGAVELSSCFLWAKTRTRSCSWASSRSSATSSCRRPAAGEPEEEDEEEEGAWPCLLSSLPAAATLVCMQDDSPSLWPWTDGMMGMEYERNGRGGGADGERQERRPSLRRLRPAAESREFQRDAEKGAGLCCLCCELS